MKKLLGYMLLAVLAVSFFSCSNDDEPNNKADGVAVYINASDMLYKDDKPAYTPTQTPGIYIGVAESAEVAKGFIRRLILDDNWDGRDTIVNLDKNGSLRITGASEALASEGIYNEVTVNFTDFEPYTLQIITEERAASENGNGYIGEGVARIH